MSCEKYREMISAEIDNELNPDEILQLSEHLAVCPECRRFKENLAEMHNMGAISEPVKLPELIERSILHNTVGTEKSHNSLSGYLQGYYRLPRGLVWCGMFLLVMLAVNTIVKPFESGPGLATVKIEPVVYQEVIRKVVLSDDDIVSVKNFVKTANESNGG